MKIRKILRIATMMAVMVWSLSACTDNDDDFQAEGPTTDSPVAEPLANGDTAPNNTLVLGSLPEEFATAVQQRFPNLSSDAQLSQIAVVDCSQLERYSTELLTVYMNKGMVIICEPKQSVLDKWLDDVNLPKTVMLNGDDKLLYAFTPTKSYLMEAKWEGTEVNDNLNCFIAWVNRTFQTNESSTNLTVDGEAKIQDLINCQQFHHEVKYSLKVQEAHEKGAAPDSISGVGSVVIAYNVYPVYAFNTEDGANDEYYLVEATTSVNSDRMTLQEPGPCMETKYWYKTWHRWVDSHGWSFFRAYCRLCGFYLTNLWTDTELVNYDSDTKTETAIADLRFPARYNPIPETTENKTTYSTSTTWGLTADLGFGGGFTQRKGGYSEGAISFAGSLAYSYSSSRDIMDINIANKSTESKAVYQYVVNNLPHYDAASITITNPPLISVATGIFDSQWIWRVPNVKVGSKDTYYLKTTIDVTYGSCHFWTTGRDFKSNNSQRPSPIDEGVAVVYQAITPPNRTPTGVLVLEHSDSVNSTVTDVKYTLDGAQEPAYQSGDNQYKPGEKIQAILPVGKYTIEFTKDTSDGSQKTYVSKSAVKIDLAKSTHVYTDFNMKEK